MVCPKWGGTLKVIAFLTDYQAVDRLSEHRKLTFVAAKPPLCMLTPAISCTKLFPS
jgi:hypothetical protein